MMWKERKFNRRLQESQSSGHTFSVYMHISGHPRA